MSSDTSVPMAAAPITPQVPRGARQSTACAEERGHAGRLDAEVHAEAGDALDLGGHLALCRVDDVSRAELAGQLQARHVAVDADDRRAARDHAGHDRREPDCTCSEDGQGAAGRSAEAVEHPAGAGLDAAAEGGRDLQRDRVRERDDVALAGDGVGGEARLPEEMPVDELAVARERTRAVGARRGEVVGPEVVAVGRPARTAGGAVAARVEAHAHALARRNLRHGGADAFHDARALVPQDGRQGHRIPLVAHDQVGVADACRGHPDEHLIGAQVAQLELLQREGR